MIEEKRQDDIEIRSDEAQEILGEVPHWILRWGITVVFLFLLLILVGSYFFRYPDIITAEVTVTTANPPAAIVCRASGKIRKLYVTDKEMVRQGDYMAVIENSARTEDILALKMAIENGDIEINEPLQLGDIQSIYINFLNAAREQKNFMDLGFYEKKIAFLQTQITHNERHLERLERQAALTKEQFEIAARRWKKDSLMHTKGGISGPERDNSLTGYLQSQQNIESTEGSLESQQMQIAQLRAELLNLQLEKLEKEGKVEQDYNHALEQLQIALKNWEMQYALISPIEGQVTFMTYWSENQTIGNGETVFVVVPEETEDIVGKALLPIARSGKVKEGQQVNVRFANYPDQEYGMVKGTVSSISLVPVEENYIIGIAFSNGLQTSYKKTLPLSQEMTGKADIITEDISLLERFFMPLRKVMKEF